MTLKRCRLLLLLLAVSSAGCRAETATPTPTAKPVATPVEATSTPRPVPPSPTARATRAPAPLYFTEPFDAKPSYWSFLQVDNGEPFAGPSVRDGFLVFDLTATNQWAYAMYGSHDYDDVMVETQAQNRTGGDGAGGVVCRYDEKFGWYELDVYADQTYQLLYGQWLAQGMARYTPLYHGTSEKIQADENLIGLSCQGSTLTPFFNGTQMRAWQETKFGLKDGKVGLAASSFEDAPFTVAFDWVKISLR